MGRVGGTATLKAGRRALTPPVTSERKDLALSLMLGEALEEMPARALGVGGCCCCGGWTSWR